MPDGTYTTYIKSGEFPSIFSFHFFAFGVYYAV